MLAAASIAALVVLLGGAKAESGAPSVDVNPQRAEAVAAGKKARKAKRGKRGPRGRKGPRGPRGFPGLPGERGPKGSEPIMQQTINIGWQNNDWKGKSTQAFEAPGIGTGYVRCTPPIWGQDGDGNQNTGDQLISFTPKYRIPVSKPGQRPKKWATTMWTARRGGNPDNANSRYETVVRTARLDRDNQQSFYESFSTAPALQHDPESRGSMTGIITTEPWEESTPAPPPTTFRISWHWNFRGPDQPNSDRRCYVSATFTTNGR